MKTLWLLFLISTMTLAPILAQENGMSPDSDPLWERERIQPESDDLGQSITPAIMPERVSDQITFAFDEESGSTVRHLWGDYDNDDFEDVFVLDAGGNLLFRNRGDGNFEDVTVLFFPKGAGCGSEGFWGDYNGDGWQDLFVFYNDGFSLYCNDGALRFSDVTEEVGLDRKLSCLYARLADYDGDGFGDFLIETIQGDRIFHNLNGVEFQEKVLGNGPGKPVHCNQVASAQPVLTLKTRTELLNKDTTSSANQQSRGNDRFDIAVTKREDLEPSGSRSGPPVQPTPVPGGPSSPSPNGGKELTANAMFLNDNSPGSVGEGIPEVEGGDDATTSNDIVDGTITGADIEDNSVDADKVIGTAATLAGSQNFDSGTLYIDASDNAVGIGTTNPTDASLHVESSDDYGCRVENDSTSGHGVHGWASAGSGFTRGVYGESSSDSGVGVYGISPGIGVRGESTVTTSCVGGVTGVGNSDEGMGVFGISPFMGVYGWTNTSSGENYGVRGDTESTEGCGVRGGCYAETGVNYGVRGDNASTTGRGVYGYASTTTGNNYGVFGESESSSGYGVYGLSLFIGVRGSSNSTSGTAYGVYGECDSSTGRGVYGQSYSTTGKNYGVYGITASETGRGIFGAATADTGSCYAIKGECHSTSGYGVYGAVVQNTGTNYGVRGYTGSALGYGVYSAGNFGCSGTKSFVQPHPKDASKEIRFVCLEGNESGTYFRGSANLKDGEAVIEVPEEFRLVTEEEGMTVQITPMGPARIWVEEYGLNEIVVAGEGDVTFHYFVNGVRRGFDEFEPVRENHAWVPEYRNQPFGTQYPEALRRILVQNGTLNSDFTPNEKTASMMGWELRDYEEETVRHEEVE